ncbi:hypothetical protein [Winogradskyella pacifica]|uniref:IPT/TIG domain-containing protein n=1 Tax=Winogradskyella pacifica TaxID=664642 RepID=A0A3D9N8A2_9FLAO|nr:hypothetical protein [Winogradskyella pacifica]REE27520.1 hypothetical protein DFQ09_101353 [Winogradskyella pacifica]
MKKNNFTLSNIATFFLMVLMIFQLTSCENEFQKDSIPEATAPPIIHSVSEAREDVPVTQGVLQGTYIIRGENLASLFSIDFNGFPAGFNPALLTDNIAFVSVPLDAPYINQTNILRLENLKGVTEYDFSLLTIEGFTEETVDGVKVVKLQGGDFTDTSTVTFVSGSEENGNLIEAPATILSISQTEVVVEVPSGIEQAFIYLATSRGAVAQSDSYGFSYSIYIDALHSDWTTSEWGGTHDLASSEVALGEFSIKSTREAWSGLSFLVPNIPFDEYDALTVSVYGTGAVGDKVQIALNDFDGAQTVQPIELIPGVWNKVVIPLSDFYPNGGAPDTIFRMDFQEASNTGLAEYIFYIDDFGFL